MAVARSRAYLDCLPNELRLEINEQTCLSARDLISLARTNRHHYRTTISAAYKAHAQHEFGVAIYWAIKNDQYKTLKRLIDNGVDVNMRDADGDTLVITDIIAHFGLAGTWLFSTLQTCENVLAVAN
ncbi:hypothetical protein FJTKL_07420 [Diaporthe vaccinii]|uniref:Ankyrin repeat protein n=1 Tax=Diaporthe vaccinii TaxID=105482 RepID=A0ABR4EU23_9PEZI